VAGAARTEAAARTTGKSRRRRGDKRAALQGKRPMGGSSPAPPRGRKVGQGAGGAHVSSQATGGRTVLAGGRWGPLRGVGRGPGWRARTGPRGNPVLRVRREAPVEPPPPTARGARSRCQTPRYGRLLLTRRDVSRSADRRMACPGSPSRSLPPLRPADPAPAPPASARTAAPPSPSARRPATRPAPPAAPRSGAAAPRRMPAAR